MMTMRVQNATCTLVRQIKEQYWKSFSRKMENDFYDIQKQIWRFMRRQRKEASEFISINHITKIQYLKKTI